MPPLAAAPDRLQTDPLHGVIARPVGYRKSNNIAEPQSQNENEPRDFSRDSILFRQIGYCDGGDAASQARTESRWACTLSWSGPTQKI